MIERLSEMAATARAGFYGPVHPGLAVDVGCYRWRVSPDARDALLAEMPWALSYQPTDRSTLSTLTEYMLGIPLELDESLPRNSVILDEDVAGR